MHLLFRYPLLHLNITRHVVYTSTFLRAQLDLNVFLPARVSFFRNTWYVYYMLTFELNVTYPPPKLSLVYVHVCERLKFADDLLFWLLIVDVLGNSHKWVYLWYFSHL